MALSAMAVRRRYSELECEFFTLGKMLCLVRIQSERIVASNSIQPQFAVVRLQDLDIRIVGIRMLVKNLHRFLRPCNSTPTDVNMRFTTGVGTFQGSVQGHIPLIVHIRERNLA